MSELANERMSEAKYSYKQLDVYKESKALVKMVYKLLKSFPKEEQFALCDQLRRAVISVPSNLAEGTGRTSHKDQAHFLEMAYGSLMEVDCQLDISHELGYVSAEDLNDANILVGRVAAMLSGMRRRCLTANSLNAKR